MKKLTINSPNILLFVVLFIAFIIGLCLFACENKKPIKVGFSGCLTGRLSDLGISGRDSALMAVEEVNASGGINGRPVELIVKDDKYDADTAVRVDKELIEEGVVAIIGHMTSSMSIAVLPIINKEKIVLISPTTSTNKLTKIDDYFFRVVAPNLRETEHFADLAFHKMNIKTIAFLYDLSNKTYTQAWYHNFKSRFEKMGGKIISTITYTSGESVNYSAISQSVISADADGIVIVGGAIDTAMICQQLKKKDFNKPILLAGWSQTGELIKHGGSAVEGVIFSASFNDQSRNKRYVEFKNRFKDRFGKEPDFAAVYSYEAVQLLINVLKSADDFDDLKPCLLKNNILEGLQGIIEIDRYGDVERKRFLVKVEKGQFVTSDD